MNVNIRQKQEISLNFQYFFTNTFFKFQAVKNMCVLPVLLGLKMFIEVQYSKTDFNIV